MDMKLITSKFIVYYEHDNPKKSCLSNIPYKIKETDYQDALQSLSMLWGVENIDYAEIDVLYSMLDEAGIGSPFREVS